MVGRAAAVGATKGKCRPLPHLRLRPVRHARPLPGVRTAPAASHTARTFVKSPRPIVSATAIRHAQQLCCFVPFLAIFLGGLTVQAGVVELRPVLVEKNGVMGVEYWSGETLVGPASDAAPAGVELLLPGAASAPVQFRTKSERGGVIELGPAKVGALTLR